MVAPTGIESVHAWVPWLQMVETPCEIDLLKLQPGRRKSLAVAIDGNRLATGPPGTGYLGPSVVSAP